MSLGNCKFNIYLYHNEMRILNICTLILCNMYCGLINWPDVNNILAFQWLHCAIYLHICTPHPHLHTYRFTLHDKFFIHTYLMTNLDTTNMFVFNYPIHICWMVILFATVKIFRYIRNFEILKSVYYGIVLYILYNQKNFHYQHFFHLVFHFFQKLLFCF